MRIKKNKDGTKGCMSQGIVFSLTVSATQRRLAVMTQTKSNRCYPDFWTKNPDSVNIPQENKLQNNLYA